MRRSFFLFFIFICLQSIAQDKTSNPIFIEGNYQYGMIWQHDPSLADVIDGNLNIFQFNIGKKTFGQSYWDQLYRYPEKGLGLYFADLGNSIKLGRAGAIYGYLNIPIFKREKFQVKYRISGGLGYLNKNAAIGSILNVYVDFCIDTKTKLGDQLYLVNAIGATHFSNGAIKKPNLGLNLFSYRLGLVYDFNKNEAIKIKKIVPEIEKRNNIVTVFSMGTKELNKFNNENYTIISGIIDYQRSLGYKYKIGTGIDVFYDESLFTTMDPDSELNLSNFDIMRYGIHLSTDTRIYNLVLAFHIGTYIHADYKKDGKIYQRVSIRYLLSESIFTNISLKTSKGVADFIEWGIGYRFKW